MKGSEVGCKCERDEGQTENSKDLDSIRLTLNLLTMLCFHIQGLTSSLRFQTGAASELQLHLGTCQPLADPLQTSWQPDCKTETGRISRGYPCIYNFTTPVFPMLPMHLLLPVYTGASCLRNPQLTALSKVNIQHFDIWWHRLEIFFWSIFSKAVLIFPENFLNFRSDTIDKQGIVNLNKWLLWHCHWNLLRRYPIYL